MLDKQITEEPRFYNERAFNKEVVSHAIHHGWRPFHVDRYNVVHGRGFPDFAMFRKHPETGKYEMLVAELKRNVNSTFGKGQEEWLEAFKQMGITTMVWRGDNDDDIQEMYDMIENGTEGYESVTNLPQKVDANNPMPFNFYATMNSIIETIQSGDMSTGELADLRRMDVRNHNCYAFWKLVGQYGMPSSISVNPIVKEKWSLIIQGIALTTHRNTNAHNPNIPVGRVLYEGDGNTKPFYNEKRLHSLLQSKDVTLRRSLHGVLRLLASKGCAFDWLEMAMYVLNDGYDSKGFSESRDKIARAYYRSEAYNNRKKN